MPKPSQEDELKKLADTPGPLKAWAIRQLIKLGLIPDPDAPALEAGAPPAAPEPVPAPEEPKEPAKVKTAGAYGNCHDCGKKFDRINQRTPFHRDTKADGILYVCRPCANRRWNFIHGK